MTDAQGALLASILAPLRAEADRLTGEIATKEAEARDLRAELRTVERVLRAANPDHKKPGPKPNQPAGGHRMVSEERVADVLEFLRAHPERYANGDGFTGTSLHRDASAALGGIGSATISAAVLELREREQIRLVKRGTGGSKIYRLVVAEQ